MNRSFETTSNITRLPVQDWDMPRQQERKTVQPWDYDAAPVGATQVWEGDVILVGSSSGAALNRALENQEAWDAFTEEVPLVTKDTLI